MVWPKSPKVTAFSSNFKNKTKQNEQTQNRLTQPRQNQTFSMFHAHFNFFFPPLLPNTPNSKNHPNHSSDSRSSQFRNNSTLSSNYSDLLSHSAKDTMQSPKTLINSPLRDPFSDELAQLKPQPDVSRSSEVSNTNETSDLGNSNSDSSDRDSLPSTPIDPMIPASPKYSSPPRCDSEGEDNVESDSWENVTQDVERPWATTDSTATISSPSRPSSSNSGCPQSRSEFSQSEEQKPSISQLDFYGPAPAPSPVWSFLPRPPPPVGAGLANLGNTCFLNAVFQCFTHTVPFVRKLFGAPGFSPHHENGEFCPLAEVRQLMDVGLSSPGKTLFPRDIVNNLNKFSSFFEINQQEDAHEFLQCLLDKLDSCLSKCVLKVAETKKPSGNETLVKEVFGGRLMSQLCCCNCGHCSITYESLIDLSLEIDDVDDLQGALKSFTKAEKLEDDEVRITCDSCKEKVSVEKQLMIDQAPSVIALHLKRFKTDGTYVEKIDKAVEYPLELDLAPYTTGDQKSRNVDELMYELYAFVEHIGWSSTSGHYISYIRSSPGKWYQFDDSEVKQVPTGFALSRRAYILFYAKKGTPWPCTLVEAMQSGDRSTSPASVLDFKEALHTSPIGVDRACPSLTHDMGDYNRALKVEDSNRPVYGLSKVSRVVEDTEGRRSLQESSVSSSLANRILDEERSKSGTDVGKSQQPIRETESDKVETVRWTSDVKNEMTHVAIDEFIYASDEDEDIYASITLKRDTTEAAADQSQIATAAARGGQPSTSRCRSPDLYSEKPPEVKSRPPTPNPPKMISRSSLQKKRNSRMMDREVQAAMRSIKKYPSCRRGIFQALLSNKASPQKKRKL